MAEASRSPLRRLRPCAAVLLVASCTTASGVLIRDPQRGAGEQPLGSNASAHALSDAGPVSLDIPGVSLSQFFHAGEDDSIRTSPRPSPGAVPFLSLDNHRIAWDSANKLRIEHEDRHKEQKDALPLYGPASQHDARTSAKVHSKHARMSHPRVNITLFKVLLGAGFAASLVMTCISRQCSLAEDSDVYETQSPVASPVAKSSAAEPAPASSDAGSAAPAATIAEPPHFAGMTMLKATVIVGLWMIFSIFFIIFNKYMFSKGGFPYPVTLTALHMGSCYIVFSVVRVLPKKWRYMIMPDVDKHIPLGSYLKGLVPAALLMAVCLGIGNLGFLYATVAFIQMVKPVNIVVTSLAGFAWGLEPATPTHLFIAILVSGGVAVAAAGDVQFSLIGLICQLCASTGEGLRLIILQGIMQGSLKLDPLSTLYRFTPVAGLALCVLSCFIEGPVNWAGLVNPSVLVLNCLMAIALNVLIAVVVQQTSAVVFVLAGVTKDIATIAISAFIYRSPVTGQEVVGYAVSMLGICLYKVYKDNLQKFKEYGMIRGFWHVGSAAVMGKKA